MADQPVVLITGASSGIGQATAMLLAEHGYRVFGTSRHPTPRPNYDLLPLEVTNEESIAACVHTLMERTGGKLDVLINNVGTGILAAAEETDVAAAKELFDINFFSAVRMTSAVLPFFRKQKYGRIINMSSMGGIVGAPYAAFYCASKFALEGYSEALRHELWPLGIYVSIVEPTAVSTPAAERAPRGTRSIDAYAANRARLTNDYVNAIHKGMSPVIVARAIRKVITAPVPALRYPVSGAAWSLGLVRAFLPAHMFEGLVRWALKVE